MSENSNSLADSYFTIRSFEKSGKLYEALGIKTWNKYFPNGGSKLSFFGCGMYTQDSKDKTRKEGFNEFIAGAKWRESFHVGLGVVYGIMSAYMLSNVSSTLLTSVLVAANIFNGYAIIAPRYNRNRVEKLQDSLLEREISE